MDRHSKLFVKTSIIYLAIGALLGLHMSFADHNVNEIRFIHIHVMLLGFMAMMIYGVAYHILPRFNAKPIPYPGWLPVQFWLANIGLVGMSALYAAGAFWSIGPLRMAFGLFGTMEVVSIFLFVINILLILKEEREEEEQAPSPPKPSQEATPAPKDEGEPVKLSPKMKIAEILEKWPGLQEAMMEEGFSDVANPAALQSIGKMVTLEQAAKKAGKDLFEVIASLEGKKLVTGDNGDKAAEPMPSVPGAETIKRGALATNKTLIGPLLESYPETATVFETHYGANCFTCPGHKTETVEQTAAMHGMPPEKILDEINTIIETTLKK